MNAGCQYWRDGRKLTWVAYVTQSDLAYTAHTLAKFGDDPRPEHCKAVRKAQQFLKRTVCPGVTYGLRTGSTKTNRDDDVCIEVHDTREVSEEAVLPSAGENVHIQEVNDGVIKIEEKQSIIWSRMPSMRGESS